MIPAIPALRILFRMVPKAVWVAALGAAVLALAFVAGGQWEKRGAALRAAESNIETRERMDDAGNSVDADNVDERLRGLSE